MASIKFNVTQEDIQKGIKRNPCYCPIALAVKRRIPDARVFVSDRILLDGIWVMVAGPQAESFIHNFDQTGEGEPFTFDAELV